MGVQVVDYRVSTLVVLCKDCGHDVGLYPARHKCQPIERPSMPALPDIYKDFNKKPTSALDVPSRTTTSHSSLASSPSPSFSSTEISQPANTNKWTNRLGKSSVTEDTNEAEESIYYNNFAANLPETESNGKKLWGKVRQNEKWKQINEKNEKPKQTAKLWGKLVQATQNMTDKTNRDERGPDSDEDDWEGETHVSRIIRAHYEKKRLPLPEWLFDDNMQMQRKPSRRVNKEVADVNTPMRTPSRRRLWDNDPDDKISNRERERQELRQKASISRKTDKEDESYSRESRTSTNRYKDNDYRRPKESTRYEDSYRRPNETRYEEDSYRRPKETRYEEDSYRRPNETRYEDDKRRPKETRYEEDSYRMRDDNGYYDRNKEPSKNVYSADKHTGDDLDDYYYESKHVIPSASRDRARYTDVRRQPSRTGNRYEREPAYF